MKTLKELVRDKMASGITDFRKVFDAIHVGHPRNRKWHSWKTVQRYVRELQDELQPSPEGQNANAVEEANAVAASTKEPGGFRFMVPCHLRNVMTVASQESRTIATVLQMGFMSVLDRLAERGHALNDPELEACLKQLCL